MKDLFAKSSAVISNCGTYRYRLDREWDAGKGTVAFLMLNPSKADHAEDDPTIRRCTNFAKAWGFGGLIVGNLFALRSTDPKALYSHHDPIGPDNDKHLIEICQSSRRIICAWGTHGKLRGRNRAVHERLKFFDLHALRVTADGHPGHPLYIAGSAVPQAFSMEGHP